MKALRSAAGVLSLDPLKRIATLERLTERLLWRLPRDVIDAHLEIPPALPAERFADARLYADREAMLSAIPTGGEVAEVGTWRGEFSRLIVERLRPRTFHLIDLDFSEFEWSGLTNAKVVTIEHQGDSSTILAGLAESSLDWLFIDGDHRYAGVRKDLAAAHLALKPGGLMTCNDYTNWASLAVAPYGVARAVNDFVVANGYSVMGLALHPAGNHDLLIRKP
jgi:hypothetical protein